MSYLSGLPSLYCPGTVLTAWSPQALTISQQKKTAPLSWGVGCICGCEGVECVSESKAVPGTWWNVQFLRLQVPSVFRGEAPELFTLTSQIPAP